MHVTNIFLLYIEDASNFQLDLVLEKQGKLLFLINTYIKNVIQMHIFFSLPFS